MAGDAMDERLAMGMQGLGVVLGLLGILAGVFAFFADDIAVGITLQSIIVGVYTILAAITMIVGQLIDYVPEFFLVAFLRTRRLRGLFEIAVVGYLCLATDRVAGFVIGAFIMAYGLADVVLAFMFDETIGTKARPKSVMGSVNAGAGPPVGTAPRPADYGDLKSTGPDRGISGPDVGGGGFYGGGGPMEAAVYADPGGYDPAAEEAYNGGGEYYDDGQGGVAPGGEYYDDGQGGVAAGGEYYDDGAGGEYYEGAADGQGGEYYGEGGEYYEEGAEYYDPNQGGNGY